MTWNEADLRRRSRLLSRVLRHRPEQVGVELDGGGWADVDELLNGLERAGHPWSRADLQRIVDENDKRRFEFDHSGCRIRAVQGHSVVVHLGLSSAAPPEVLFHGAVATALPTIERDGLLRMKRHHVHLHADPAVAASVGARRGPPIVLRVRAAAMHAAGFEFLVAANGVWLTDHVPPGFLDRV